MAGPDHSDEELMERYRDGDAAAFDVIYGRHRGGLFRYILRQCGNRSVAEELFQEVWMNLIRARASYTVQAKFSTYLYRLAHNRVVDHYRSRSNGLANSTTDDEAALESAAAPAGDDPAVAVDSRQQAQRLLRLVDELPPAQREAFLLQQEGDLSVEEIAQATGVTRETAKSRLRYALAKLRQGMRLN